VPEIRPTRDAIFAMAARRLREEFQAAAVVPHRGLRGDEVARLIRDFLNERLPKRFTAGSGFIIDRDDAVSKQTDVVIYDALNCPVYRASEEAAIIPNENVAAVVEVKSSLDKEKLLEAAENIAAAKLLRKTIVPDTAPVLIQSSTLGLLFAFDTTLTLETIEKHYREALHDRLFHSHIDAILVLDRALITLGAQTPGYEWAHGIFEGPGGVEGTHFGIATLQLEDASLDAWFRLPLAHLAHFRGIVDHPGFGYTSRPNAQLRITYTGSFTHEQDPEKRARKLEEYREQVRRSFSGEASKLVEGSSS
jgi:hypothetical protein